MISGDCLYTHYCIFIQWMPIEEYAAQLSVKKHELLKYIVDICLVKIEKGYAGFSPVSTKSIMSAHNNFFYLNERDLSQH